MKNMNFNLKQITAVIFTGIFAMTCTCGCGQESAEDTAPKPHENGTFDIESVRRNVHIKGYDLVIPQKLSKLADGLSYKFGDKYDFGGETTYEVDILAGDTLIFDAVTYKKGGSAEVNNICIYDSDSDIDGITPQITTMEEVLERYGEPTTRSTSSNGETENELEIFIYGSRIEPENHAATVKGQFLNVVFDNGTVRSTSVTYFD